MDTTRDEVHLARQALAAVQALRLGVLDELGRIVLEVGAEELVGSLVALLLWSMDNTAAVTGVTAQQQIQYLALACDKLEETLGGG